VGGASRNTPLQIQVRVRARNVYPGIDLVYYGSGQPLEYDFVVAPGADPGRIRLGFEGAQGLALDPAGDLHVRLATGELVQHAPLLYQEAAGRRRPVDGRFVLAGYTVGFQVGAYDPTLPLVIDPVLAWASLLGGTSTEWTFDVAVTANGQAYACGYTYSTDFPTRPTAADPDPADGPSRAGSPSAAAVTTTRGESPSIRPATSGWRARPTRETFRRPPTPSAGP
jgi:hypothetical protein